MQWQLPFVVILNAVLSAAQLFGDNVCQKQEVYTVSIQVKVKEPVTITTYTWCMKIPPRCAKEKVILRDKYKILYEPRTRLVNVCCEGYAPDKNGTKCVPVCSGEHTCVHGRCEGPDRCVCEPGYTGHQCDRVCPPGFFGQDCSGMCYCKNNGTCHHIDGVCLCTAGWSGPQCEMPCPEGTYGKNCLSKCQCQSVYEMCHPYNGTCISLKEFMKGMEEETDFETFMTGDSESSDGEIMMPVESENRKHLTTELPDSPTAATSVQVVTPAPILTTVKSSIYDKHTFNMTDFRNPLGSDNIMHIPRKVIKKEPILENEDFETTYEVEKDSIKTDEKEIHSINYSTSTTPEISEIFSDDKTRTTQTVPYTISKPITFSKNEDISDLDENPSNVDTLNTNPVVGEESYSENSDKQMKINGNITESTKTPLASNANITKPGNNYVTVSMSDNKHSDRLITLNRDDIKYSHRLSTADNTTNSSDKILLSNINDNKNNHNLIKTIKNDTKSSDRLIRLDTNMTDSSETQNMTNPSEKGNMTTSSEIHFTRVNNNESDHEYIKTSVSDITSSDSPLRLNVSASTTYGQLETTNADDMKRSEKEMITNAHDFTHNDDRISTNIDNKRTSHHSSLEESFLPISEEAENDDDEKNIIDHEQLKQVLDTQATVREQAIHEKGSVFRGISDLVFSVCVAAGVAIILIVIALGIILVVHRRGLRKTLLVNKVPKSGDTLGMSIYSGSTVYTNVDDIIFPERDIHARCVFTGPDVTATAGECCCEKKQTAEENSRRDSMTSHYDIPPPARCSLTTRCNDMSEPIYEEIPGWSSRTTSFQTFSSSQDNSRG